MADLQKSKKTSMKPKSLDCPSRSVKREESHIRRRLDSNLPEITKSLRFSENAEHVKDVKLDKAVQGYQEMYSPVSREEENMPMKWKTEDEKMIFRSIMKTQPFHLYETVESGALSKLQTQKPQKTMKTKTIKDESGKNKFSFANKK